MEKNKIYSFYSNFNLDPNIILKKYSDYIEQKSNQDNVLIKKNKFLNKIKTNNLIKNSMGIYIPYSLLYPDFCFEFLDESSLIIKNVDKSDNQKNIFKWKNTLDNKIKNLIYIYIHLVTIPKFPFLNKIKIDLPYSINLVNIINTLIDKYNNNTLVIDENYIINSNNISIAYFNNNIIDFVIDDDHSDLYSIEITTNTSNNIINSILYLYNRSDKSILDESYLYLDIDINNNLKTSDIYSTNYLQKKFNFQLLPIHKTAKFIYFKGMGQYIQKALNDLVNINNFNIQIVGTSNNILNNIFINNYLYSNGKPNCTCNFDNDLINNKTSCYCNYIRHPFNLNNQIDISLKIGQIKNELINNIFN